MYCPNCGTDVGDSNFCPKCGTKVSIDGTVPETSAPSSAVGVKTVDKLAFSLLAFLLGTFGIHRFYAGRMFSGIMYLLFFWTGVPSILGIIEFVVAIVKDGDQNGKLVVDPDRYFI